MARLFALLSILFVVIPVDALDTGRGAGGVVLAGERVQFDQRSEPQFTQNQIDNTAEATRVGLERWASTEHGRRLIAWFTRNACVIVATEDTRDSGAGRAPEPGLATLIAAGDHSRVKTYALTLNPDSFVLPEGMTPMPNQPATAADLMAAAWAAEMLHVSFYSRGISLPHHSRADFQQEWRAVSAELGFPGMLHDDSSEEGRQALRRSLAHRYNH